MSRLRMRLTVFVIALLPAATGLAQQTDLTPLPQPPPPPEAAILQALQADPTTAPYSFTTSTRNGKVVLKGRVGSKNAYDVAIHLAMAVTTSVDDRLVIDTTALPRPAPIVRPAPPIDDWGFIYPPPLFGRLDDPFFGFEPPVITYPPWWGEMTSRIRSEVAVESETVALNHDGDPLPEDTVEMTIDPLGVAVLRGSVPTLADSIAIGQKLAKSPGVVEVRNLLKVRETDPKPPAPPRPDSPQTPREPRAIPIDTTGVGDRVAKALKRRPALEGSDVRSKVVAGVAYLEGNVATALEAMIAFRAAQQTPGVERVVDRLEFAVPDGRVKNPLLEKGRPEDVEPYLEAQVRRQLGDQAHVDRVRVRGDLVEIHGTVAEADDRERVEALLRSVPVLRGFRLDAQFIAE